MSGKLLIIGQTRHAVTAAIRAARAGQPVTLVRPVAADSSLIPISEFLNVAVRALDGPHRSTLTSLSELSPVERLRRFTGLAFSSERSRIERALNSEPIRRLHGDLQFVDSHALRIRSGRGERSISAEEIILATGTVCRLPLWLPIDRDRVVTGERLMQLDAATESVSIIGGGRRGRQAAQLAAACGLRTRVLESDPQQAARVARQLQSDSGVQVEPHEVIGVDYDHGGCRLQTLSGRPIHSDAVVVAIGQEARTHGLNLDAAGVYADERGRIWCDEQGRTWTPHIRVIGELIGFPRRQSVPQRMDTTADLVGVV